jgi:hypothetical protein
VNGTYNFDVAAAIMLLLLVLLFVLGSDDAFGFPKVYVKYGNDDDDDGGGAVALDGVVDA